MLLTIHNLPPRTEYDDVRELISSKCGLKESIIDNLQNEGSGMRVTVGVLAEEDAAILVRKINGIYYRGQQLYVEDKRLKKDSEQPYRTSMMQQPQVLMGIDYNSQMQATLQNMYSQPANFGLYQPQQVGQGIPNTFMYGGQQQQLLAQYSGVGAFNNFAQQTFPLAQQNLEPEDPIYRSSSRDRGAEDAGGREAGRGAKPSAAWNTRPVYQDAHTPRNERPEHPTRFDKTQDMYAESEPRQYDDMRGRSLDTRDSRGGPSSTRDMRGGHSSGPRDMRGGHSSGPRDMRGGHSSGSRGMRGGHSSNARDMRGGHSSSPRDMRGDHSSSSYDMRGGHPERSFDTRGGHSERSFDTRGGPYSSPRDMRGGYSSGSRGMRGGPSSRSRGMRGGPPSKSRDMRGYDSGDYASDVPEDRPRFSKKRRWDDPSEQVAHEGRPEPPPKKFAPQPSRGLPAFQKAPPEKVATFFKNNPTAGKELKVSIAKGMTALLYKIRDNLQLVSQFERPSVLKSTLRKAIGFRVAELVETDILSEAEIVERYRATYPETEDFQLYACILQNLEEKGIDPDSTPDQGSGAPKPSFNQGTGAPKPSFNQGSGAPKPSFNQGTGAPKPSFNQGTEAPKPSVSQAATPKMAAKPKKPAKNQNNPRPLSPGKIPSYPLGSKKVHSQLKRQQKKQMQTLEACHVNANFQKVMEEEADLIGAILEKEFKKPQTELEREVYARVSAERCIHDCKKMVMYHLSRRITNSGLKLVRVFGKPKPPRRADLEYFLAPYRCLSLKKSVKGLFYTASFDRHDTVDILCSMPPVEIGPQILVTFKHMYMWPKNPKLDQKRARQIRMQQIKNLMEVSKVNLLDKNWPAVEQEEKIAKAEKKSANEPVDATLASPTDVTNVTDNQHELVQVTECGNVADEQTEGNDFLHVDFKVIDEVRGSDNDETGNDTSEGQVKDENVISTDWVETGEDWDSHVGDNTGNDTIAEDYNEGDNNESANNEGEINENANNESEINENANNEIEINENANNEGEINENANNQGENNENANNQGENNENANNEGDINENVNNEGESDQNVADEGENDDNDENDDENDENDDENDVQNVGDIDIADVDWDDLNEDDLEDY